MAGALISSRWRGHSFLDFPSSAAVGAVTWLVGRYKQSLLAWDDDGAVPDVINPGVDGVAAFLLQDDQALVIGAHLSGLLMMRRWRMRLNYSIAPEIR